MNRLTATGTMEQQKLPTRSVEALRAAGLCGLAAFVTFNIGWIAGDIAQPRAFSPANDDISYLGALTASKPWLYNQVGANVTGVLVICLGIGLWRALSPSRLGRAGAAALIATGLGAFLDGIFRLDCQPIDAGCSNDSWHSHAHKIESDFTAAATFIAILLLALAFRRIPAWRDSWLPSLIAVPAIFLASFVFSAVGNGAGQRAGDFVVFLWIAFVSVRLLQKGDLPAAS
jgi:putative Mn2+ efflux pump MntP